MMKILRFMAKFGAKSNLLKKIGTKLATRMLPEEFEIRLEGSRFVFRPRIDGLWNLDYSLAEPGVSKVISENLRKGDTFVDIGAYIGYYSILARNIVGDSGKVFAFEPNPESYNILRKNIELNGYLNCIAENIALSDESRFSELFIGKFEDSSSLFVADGLNRGKYIIVKTISFDEYSGIYGIVPNLVKIDAEGSEYRILRGMQNTIDTHHPILVIEIHPSPLEKQGVSLTDFFLFLKELGYEIQLLNEHGTETIPIEELVKLCRLGRKNKYGTSINQHILCKGLLK